MCIRDSHNTAPSMTMPAVTYFHSATSSFRASATMVVFLRRPPLWLTRSLNHRASADCGWCRSHSQASWIIVVRSRGLPALDTPCSCATDPLCQGVGASPAYAPSCFRLVKLRQSPSDQRTATNSAPMPFRSANIACGAGSCPVFTAGAVSYTHLRAHETVLDLVCRLLLEKK